MNAERPERDWFEKADQDLEMAGRARGPQATTGDGLLPRPTMFRESSQRLSYRPLGPFPQENIVAEKKPASLSGISPEKVWVLDQGSCPK